MMSTLLKGEMSEHTLGQRHLFKGIGENKGLGTGKLFDNVYDEINRWWPNYKKCRSGKRALCQTSKL